MDGDSLMAYTVGKLHIDGNSGKCAIFNVEPGDTLTPGDPGDIEPFTDPMDNLGRLHFHSDLPYLEVFYDVTTAISFPSRISTSSATWAADTHGLGSRPHAFLLRDGVSVQGMEVLQANNWGGYRAIGLKLDENDVSVTENYSATPSVPIGAGSATVRIILLRPAPALDPGYPMIIDPDNGHISFGNGKFSTLGNPKVRLTNGTPDFYLPALGPNIHTSGVGLRHVAPDGTVTDYFGYGGSFAPAPPHKVVF